MLSFAQHWCFIFMFWVTNTKMTPAVWMWEDKRLWTCLEWCILFMDVFINHWMELRNSWWDSRKGTKGDKRTGEGWGEVDAAAAAKPEFRPEFIEKATSFPSPCWNLLFFSSFSFLFTIALIFMSFLFFSFSCPVLAWILMTDLWLMERTAAGGGEEQICKALLFSFMPFCPTSWKIAWQAVSTSYGFEAVLSICVIYNAFDIITAAKAQSQRKTRPRTDEG